MSDRLIRIKWAGPNTPYISVERTDERLYPTKREMLELLVELKSFVDYYKDQFVEPGLDYTDDFTEEELEYLGKINERL